MTPEIWLAWARPDLLPDTWHAGYGTAGAWIIAPEVARDQKFGTIWHSAAGFWSPPGYTPQDLMRSRGNSWDLTVMRDGEVWKHRPRPTFVNWHGGGPAQNLLLGGFEVEGTGPWTPAQKRSILRVNVETHRYFGWKRARLGFAAPDRSSQDSIRGTIALVGKGGNYEHNWVSYTTCPDGRDEWDWLIAETNRQLQEGEEDDMKLYAGTPSGRVFIVGAEGKRYIGNPLELSAHHKAGLKSIEMPDAEIAAIPDQPKPMTVTTTTLAQIKKALLEVLRR